METVEYKPGTRIWFSYLYLAPRSELDNRGEMWWGTQEGIIKSGPVPYWPGGGPGCDNNDPKQWWYIYNVLVGHRLDGTEIVEPVASYRFTDAVQPPVLAGF